MDQERQRAIASQGGRAAHQQGHAHEFDSREAREAGRRGGEAVSRDRGHMAEIGARGGHNSHGGRRHDDRPAAKGGEREEQRSLTSSGHRTPQRPESDHERTPTAADDLEGRTVSSGDSDASEHEPDDAPGRAVGALDRNGGEPLARRVDDKRSPERDD